DLRPHGGEEQERDADGEEVDERDEVEVGAQAARTTATSAATWNTDTHEELRIGSEVRVAAHARSVGQRRGRQVHAEVDACASASAAFWKMRRLPSTRFSSVTTASLMPSTRCCVRDWRNAYPISAGMAVRRPNAVQFMASAIPAERMVAFSAGSTFATARKQWIRPTTA